MRKLMILLLLVSFAVSCSDDSDSPSKESFTEANAGSWFGTINLPGEDPIDMWWVIDRGGKMFYWNYEYDGECGAMLQDTSVRILKNTSDEFVFTSREGELLATWTLVRSGGSIVVEMSVEDLSVDFRMNRDDWCYSIVG